MGDYYNQARGTIEIILPEGHIIQPAGCIILPEGRRRPEVEAARGQDNASQGRNNVAWGQDNFYWPEGKVVIITFLYRRADNAWWSEGGCNSDITVGVGIMEISTVIMDRSIIIIIIDRSIITVLFSIIPLPQ